MTASDKTPSRKEHAFRIEIYGYSPEWFRASSIGVARYAAYRAFRGAGHRWNFHKFLINVRASRDASFMGHA